MRTRLAVLLPVLVTIGGTMLVQRAIARPSGVITGAGRSVTGVWVASSSDYVEINGTVGWTDLPGASIDVKIPTGTTALLVADFAAEARCVEGNSGDHCNIRVVVGDTEANPVSDPGGPPPFDLAAFGFYQGNTGFVWPIAFDRSIGPLAAGSYTVKVQYEVVNATLDVGTWHLKVERVRSS
jgi:hypothetical protein